MKSYTYSERCLAGVGNLSCLGGYIVQMIFTFDAIYQIVYFLPRTIIIIIWNSECHFRVLAIIDIRALMMSTLIPSDLLMSMIMDLIICTYCLGLMALMMWR